MGRSFTFAKGILPKKKSVIYQMGKKNQGNGYRLIKSSFIGLQSSSHKQKDTKNDLRLLKVVMWHEKTNEVAQWNPRNKPMNGMLHPSQLNAHGRKSYFCMK